MKRHMKQELRSAALILVAIVMGTALAAAPVGAQEVTWGGTVDHNGSALFADHQDETDATFSIKTALWLKSLFTPGETTSIEVDVQPSYTWTDERPYLVDLDRAKADLRVSELAGPSTVLRGSVGRFRFADASNSILTHTLDGVDMQFSAPIFRVRAAAGYSGLILNPVSSIRMSETDDADSGDDEVFWGPRRIIALGEVSFPGIIFRQTPLLAYIGQWDLRDADEDEGEDTLNSQYIGVRVDGPIIPGLFHDFGFYLSPSKRELPDDTEKDLGILASARLRYFRSDWNSSRISLGGVVVAGVGDGQDAFYTISTQQGSTVSDVPFENLAYGELSYGLKPLAGAASRVFRDLQTTVAGRTLFRMSTDQNFEDLVGAKVEDKGRYVGTEATVQVGWRILSDIGTSVTGGMFFPGTGKTGVFTDERKPEYLLRWQVSASF